MELPWLPQPPRLSLQAQHSSSTAVRPSEGGTYAWYEMRHFDQMRR